MVYVFKNLATDEVRRSESFASAPAARLVGIEQPYRGKLPEPWVLTEIWDAGERIYSLDDC